MFRAGTDPAQVLRDAGLRATPQRLAIAREVLGRNHPTAGEVFEAVRAEYPTIGLGTVYAALNTMKERGLVSVLPVADAVRFDANVLPHANLICTQCGTIVDFDDCQDVLEQLRDRTRQAGGFTFAAERLDLYGTCAACRARRG
ncbi:MAG: transcriptional repressor [Chloroflexi bacterium]|nr:transcriptional repressor [Chloroflexota bacterium]